MTMATPTNIKAAKLKVENEFPGPDYEVTRQRLFEILDNVAADVEVPDALLLFGSNNGFNELGMLKLQRVLASLA